MKAVYRKDRARGEREIEELPGGGMLIPSFTDPHKSYEVHPESGYCGCERYTFTGTCTKHPALAEAIQAVRHFPVGRTLAEARLTELAHRIYAPVKGETPRSSYDLFNETVSYRHSTERLRTAALRRHLRVMAMQGFGEVAS